MNSEHAEKGAEAQSPRARSTRRYKGGKTRGRKRDAETELRVREIHAQLLAYGFAATNPQIAAALSIERGTRVTADMVRARRRRWES